jgi:hypothetical protein
MFPSNRFSFAVHSGAREMSQSTQANELRLGGPVWQPWADEFWGVPGESSMVYPVYSWLDGSKVKNDHGMKRSPNFYDNAKTYKDSFSICTQHSTNLLFSRLAFMLSQICSFCSSLESHKSYHLCLCPSKKGGPLAHKPRGKAASGTAAAPAAEQGAAAAAGVESVDLGGEWMARKI